MSNNRYKRDGRADILDIYFGKDSEQRSSLLITQLSHLKNLFNPLIYQCF